MKKYNTVVIVPQNIYDKIQKYMQILAKKEFSAFVENVCFVNENSAGELPPAVFDMSENIIFLYGLITTPEEHAEAYSKCENSRKIHSNGNHYMLFAQNKFNERSLTLTKAAKETVKKTFDIGIIEDDDPEDCSSELDEYKEDIRCIKLIALAMAIISCNNSEHPFHLSKYYMTASIDLNYKKIYYAIINAMCKYTEEKELLQKTIEESEEIIKELENKKPKICKGIFEEENTFFENVIAKKLKDSIDAEHFISDLEKNYDANQKGMAKSISNKVKIARYALGEADDIEPITYVDKGNNNFVPESNINSEKSSQRYMTIVDTNNGEEIDPNKVLERPNTSIFNDAYVKAFLPLAKEFDKRERVNTYRIMLISSLVAFVFVLFSGFIYYIRYKQSGFVDADFSDVVNVLAIPFAAVIFMGLIGAAFILIKYIKCRFVFGKLYKTIDRLFIETKKVCANIKQYVDNYLTVYYNYHIKFAQIKKLKDIIQYTKKKIEDIDKKIEPLNQLAERLDYIVKIFYDKKRTSIDESKHSFDIRKDIENELKEIDRDKEKMSSFVLNKINEDGPIEIRNSEGNNIKIQWIKRLSFDVGNINS